MDNYRENVKWRTASGLAFWGMTVQSAFIVIGLAIGLFLAYNSVDILLDGIMPSLMSGSFSYYEDRMIGYGAAIFICWFVSLFGYFCYLAGVCLFVGPQDSENSKLKARNIMIVELVMPILLIIYFLILYKGGNLIFDSMPKVITFISLPFLGSLAAVLILRSQFGGLAKEKTWTDKAREGAKDIKLSYSLILWMVVGLILWIIIISATVIDYMSSLQKVQYSSHGYSGMYEGINSYAKQVEAFVSTVKIETIFFDLIILCLTVMSVIKRTIGWCKIQKSVDEEATRTAGYRAAYSGTARFCHKCGAQLPDGAAFCPGCGTAAADNAATETYTSATTQVFEIEKGNGEETDKRKKWYIIGGIAAGLLIIVALLVTFCGRSDKEDEDTTIEDMIINEYDEYGSEDWINEESEDLVDEESEDLVDEESEAGIPSALFPKADDYYIEPTDIESSPINLTGQIDGKYGIRLELYVQDDHTVGGTIRYLKYNIPMDVSGRWSESSYGDKEITVSEYSDGKVSGTFFGTYDGITYSGTWKSADGKRQMPFKASR